MSKVTLDEDLALNQHPGIIFPEEESDKAQLKPILKREKIGLNQTRRPRGQQPPTHQVHHRR